MKHNFWSGMGVFLLTYYAVRFIAILLVGSDIYGHELWPASLLIIFIPMYLLTFGYSLTQKSFEDSFSFAKDVSDVIFLGCLGHYTGNFFITLVIYLAISFIQRSLVTFTN